MCGHKDIDIYEKSCKNVVYQPNIATVLCSNEGVLRKNINLFKNHYHKEIDVIVEGKHCKLAESPSYLKALSALLKK
jgi:hypothetical protein